MCSSREKEKINCKLEQIHAFIEWSKVDPQSCQVQIRTRLTRQTDHFATIAENWESGVLKCIEEALKCFGHENVKILKDSWETTVTEIDNTIKAKDDLFIEASPPDFVVHVYGGKAVVQRAASEIQNLQKIVLEELDRKQKSVSEQISLSAGEMQLVDKNQILVKIKQQYPSLQVDVDTKKCTVTVKGLPTEIMATKLQILEFKSTLLLFDLKIDSMHLPLVQHEDVKNHLDEKLKAKNVECVWLVRDKVIQITTLDRNAQHEAQQVFDYELVKSKYTIPTVSLSLLETKIWKDFFLKTKQEYEKSARIVSEADRTITIATLNMHAAAVHEIVENFFKQNTVVSESIKIAKGKARLIQQHHKTDLQKIASDFKSFAADLGISDSDEVTIQCTLPGMSAVKERLRQFLGNILNKTHDITQPGMAQYFQKEGRQFLELQESRFMATIEFDDGTGDGDDSDIADDANHLEQLSPAGITSEKYKIQLGNKNVNLVLEHGDITTCQVDMIVNAANRGLHHIAGVAGAIVKQGKCTCTVCVYVICM